MSNSPRASRGNSPKTPQKPSPKIPRPTVASPRVRPPPVPARSYTTEDQSKAEDNTSTYNQSQHSYLELLQDVTPAELEAVQASQAASAQEQNPGNSKKPRKKGSDPAKETSEGDVKKKAKALESKFKLSTSPTLGRQKLTDGKYTSVVDGDVYKQ